MDRGTDNRPPSPDWFIVAFLFVALALCVAACVGLVARLRDGVLSYMTIATNPHQDIESRMRWICGNIWPLITRRTFVVLEAPYVTANGDTTMKLAGLHYVLRYGLYARGVPFGVVTPSQLKAFACDKGNASKLDMVSMAAATYGPNANLAIGHWQMPNPEDLADNTNSHEADALHALTMAIHHTGLSYADGGAMQPGISADQLQYLRDITLDWPELEWEK
jgi:Holliday junction resolvasome RuvABC endonuclease subunit